MAKAKTGAAQFNVEAPPGTQPIQIDPAESADQSAGDYLMPGAPPVSIIAALEKHSQTLFSSGMHAQHALVSEVVLAAGALKQKTAAAHGRISGDLGAVIDRLHAML